MRMASLFLGFLAVPFTLTQLPDTSIQEDTYAFVDVAVIPMDRERVLEHQTVVVRDGKITELGPAATTTVPQGVVTIDGRGKFLMPGIAEMHAHIPNWNESRRFAEQVLFLYLANGVTTIRGMLGHPSHLTLRKQVAAAEVWSPRIYTSGPSVNGRSVQTVNAAVKTATEQEAAGYDFIKIHPGLEREVFDALDATADRVGIVFSGHVPTAVGLNRALEAGYASIDHLDGYMHVLVADGAPVDLTTGGGFFGVSFVSHVDESKIAVVAAATRDAGVWNVPTQVLMENFATQESAEDMRSRPEMRYMPPQTVVGWERRWTQWKNSSDGPSAETLKRYTQIRRKLIKALHDAGAGLLLGSDAPQVWNVPGFSAQRELKTYVAAGLTPFEALETGTRNVAIFFDAEDEAGTVAVGKNADFILLEANPLEDIGNISRQAGVMIAGRWMPRQEIEARLSEMAAYFAEQN